MTIDTYEAHNRIEELASQIKRWQRERDSLDDLIDFAYQRIDDLKEGIETE